MLKKALMIDTETLGLRPDSVVLQVAAAVMDLETGEVLDSFDAQLSDDEQRERYIDVGTVRWWMQQDRAVADSVFKPRTPLPLAALRSRLAMLGSGAEVWANPSTFDIPLLENLLLGVPGPKLWAYNKVRCLKTAASILDPDGTLKPPANDAAHNAAADVRWQLQYLRNMYLKANGRV